MRVFRVERQARKLRRAQRQRWHIDLQAAKPSIAAFASLLSWTAEPYPERLKVPIVLRRDVPREPFEILSPLLGNGAAQD